MSQTSLLVIAPSECLALSAQSTIQPLPPSPIILDDWLVWYTEVSTNQRRPVGAVVNEGWVVQCLTCGCEVEKAASVKVWGDQDEYVEWKVE